jgi:hypothetical protein
MSLIVDINPVPWEILEQVKARILRNRAKKQKRQPEKGKELRRVMQVDNGILAKQRWEEPSFVLGLENRVPYVVVVVGGGLSRKVIKSRPRLQFYDIFVWDGLNAPYYYAADGTGEGGWYFGMWYYNQKKYYYSIVQNYTYLGSPVYEAIEDIAVQLNELTIGIITPPSLDTFVAYLFTWSTNLDTQNRIKEIVANRLYENKSATTEFTITTIPPTRSTGPEDVLSPEPRFYPITLNWKTIVIDDLTIKEPEVGDQIQLKFVPTSLDGRKYGDSESIFNAAIHYGLVDSFGRAVTIDPSANIFTATEHDFAANDAIAFFATQGTLPSPLTEGRSYFVRGEGLTLNTFAISLEYGGNILDITGPANGAYFVNHSPNTFSTSTAISSIQKHDLKFL